MVFVEIGALRHREALLLVGVVHALLLRLPHLLLLPHLSHLNSEYLVTEEYIVQSLIIAKKYRS